MEDNKYYERILNPKDYLLIIKYCFSLKGIITLLNIKPKREGLEGKVNENGRK